MNSPALIARRIAKSLFALWIGLFLKRSDWEGTPCPICGSVRFEKNLSVLRLLELLVRVVLRPSYHHVQVSLPHVVVAL